jgi:hypothetical protein
MLYSQTSPYYSTQVFDKKYLDVMQNRSIPMNPLNKYWEITQTYNLRPDLLAYDLYNDAGLWWVFAQRNPNTLADPLFDFTTGKKIYLPELGELKKALGF